MRAFLLFVVLSSALAGCVDSRYGRVDPSEIRDAAAPDRPDSGTVEQPDAEPPPDGGCGPFFTPCGASCVDVTSDESHCGGCFQPCGFGETCSDRLCISDCVPSCGIAECGDDGCGGSCGTCDDFSVCDFGTCVSTAPSGGESCASATSVSAGTYSFTFDGRFPNHTPFSCSTTVNQPDVTFRYVAPRSGTATFETGGSNDVVLAVFGSSSCGSADSLGCDDDTGAGNNSLLSLDVSAGFTYYIVIAPYGTATPGGTMTLMVTDPP